MNYKENPAKTWIVLRTESGKAPKYVDTFNGCYGVAEARVEYVQRYLHDEQHGTIITLINQAHPSMPVNLRVKAASPTLENI